MRTVVNVRTGGRTRISGMIHALFLLAVVLGLGAQASYIPNAVLAGILVKVGLDIIDWNYIKNSHKGPAWDLALMVIVLGLTIFVDLITAVAVGVILASIAFVRQIAKTQMERLKQTDQMLHAATDREKEILEKAEDLITIFDFDGPLSFGAAADLGHHARTQLEGGAHSIILDFTRMPTLDVSAALAIETITGDAKHSNRKVYNCGMNEEVLGVLKALEADKHVPESDHYATREQALEAAFAELPK